MKYLIGFIAGLVVYQIVATLWALLIPVVFIGGGCWLLMRYLFPHHDTDK